MGITVISVIFMCIFMHSSGAFSVKELADLPQPVNGLSWTFYGRSCPNLESIVKERIEFYLNKDITQAAGLLRLHFHDCFVQGCDASLLLDGSASGPSEKDAIPNLNLRAQAFAIINDIKKRAESACKGTVSCSDILALAARDSVTKAGGPVYPVPLGRRDGLNFATKNATLDSLPPPTSNVTGLMSVLSKLGLDLKDLVALSGHTIGIGHCSSFTSRLYPAQDSTLEKNFTNNLKKTCPNSDTDNFTDLDLRSPNAFDNKYYVDLMNKQTLFTSDQTLYTDARTRDIVKSFAEDQRLFFDNFVASMIKMGQLNVLTGNKGQIRRSCNVRNPTAAYSYEHPSIQSSENSEQSLSASM
ncbi:cationic peroxidase SPC4 [Cryptomeria japonica]|uniref:cationic peroxidase SPC4 n=1 Tax=Cryptomeria japonica TaxID=3369 RepID=UPI0027DA24ED|nr:cationic peroxidase SPC4 [Cryptomeria japonica]